MAKGFFKKFLNNFLTKVPILGDLIGLVSGGVNLVQSLSNRWKKKADYQDQIADQNYEKQLADKRQLIEEDRQYQSIGAVMQRAKSAGVSPLAALGVSSGNSVSADVPSQSSPTIDDNSAQMASNWLSAVQSLREYKIRKKQIEIEKTVADATSDEKKANASLARQKEMTERQNTLSAQIKNSHLDEREKAEIEALIADRKLDEAEARFRDAVTDTENKTRSGKVAKLNAEVANIIAHSLTENTMRSINAELARSNIRLNAQQISESISVESMNWQQVNNLLEEEKLTIAQKNKCEDELKTLEKERQRIQAEIENIKSDTSLNETRKKEYISRIVANYTHSVTDVVKTLATIFKSNGKSDEDATNMAESFFTDVTLGAIGTIFD